MSRFKVTVIHNGESVDTFPVRGRKGHEDSTSFDAACQRIGMMVMSSAVTDITVYRDGEVYRTVQVVQQEVQVKA